MLFQQVSNGIANVDKALLAFWNEGRRLHFYLGARRLVKEALLRSLRNPETVTHIKCAACSFGFNRNLSHADAAKATATRRKNAARRASAGGRSECALAEYIRRSVN